MRTNVIYNGDCLEILSQMPEESIDLIVTDPPYKVTSRGSAGSMGGYWADEKCLKGDVFEHNDCDIYNYLPLFFRVLKPKSHCYIMCNNLNLPHFFDVISKSDFNFLKLLVWDKQSKICGRYYMGQVEHIFFLRKGGEKPINNCSTSDLLSFSNFNRPKDSNNKNLHNSIKPVSLMQCLIENSSDVGSLVLDPFIGSGTSAIAAIRSKRRYIGIDLDESYCKVAQKRIKEETMQLSLF